MLGVLCARPKPRIFTSLSFLHVSAAHHRLSATPIYLLGGSCSGADWRRRYHSTSCSLGGSAAGAASIWHVILPSGSYRRIGSRPPLHHEQKGEGSWNVAWDARPARWLHRSDSAWLLFGVCPCLAPVNCDVNSDGVAADEKTDGCSECVISDENKNFTPGYTVTGVKADGRCLFRAIAHATCLRSGEHAPDETRQTELADELRAQVADELLKRREESEWFIEGDFDAYVKRIRQPYVWGGEPELLMASHVLRIMIAVFMIDRSSGGLTNIANYGQEYSEGTESPINVLFHGYGHYDMLETLPN